MAVKLKKDPVFDKNLPIPAWDAIWQGVYRENLHSSTVTGFTSTDTGSPSISSDHIAGRECATITDTVATDGRDSRQTGQRFKLVDDSVVLLGAIGFHLSHITGEISFGFGANATTVNWTDSNSRFQFRKLLGETQPKLRLRDASAVITEFVVPFTIEAAKWIDLVIWTRRLGADGRGEVGCLIETEGGQAPFVYRREVKTGYIGSSSVYYHPFYGYRIGDTVGTGAISHFGSALGRLG